MPRIIYAKIFKLIFFLQLRNERLCQLVKKFQGSAYKREKYLGKGNEEEREYNKHPQYPNNLFHQAVGPCVLRRLILNQSC